MIKNIIPFIIDSEGTFIPTYKPNIKARTSNVNILQVIAPFDTMTNISVTYRTKHIKQQSYTEYLILTNLKGKDVINPTHLEYQRIVNWNVWEITISEYPLNLLVSNRSTKASINFNILDIVKLESYPNTIKFGNNKEDIPQTPLVNTEYVNIKPNFFSTIIGRRLYEGESFKANQNLSGYENITIGNLVMKTEEYDLIVEPAFLGDISSGVVPEGIDINNILDGIDVRLDEIEEEVLGKVFGIDDVPLDGALYGRRDRSWSYIDEQVALDILNALNIDASPVEDSTVFPSFDVIDGGDFIWE